MISETDTLMLCFLRRNARERIASIAKKTNIPATTLYDRYRAHQKKFIQRHVTLVDFARLGLLAKANISIKVDKSMKDKLEKYLLEHPNVNTLLKINMGYDFLVEVLFKDYKELHHFVQDLETNYMVQHCDIFNVISELKREALFTKPEHLEVLRK